MKNRLGIICVTFIAINVNADTTSELLGNERWEQEVYYESGPYGGHGGHWFTDFWMSRDEREVLPEHWPDTVNLRHGGGIDSIQVFYGDYQARLHGGEGGKLERIRLFNGDKIVRVTGRQGIGPGAAVDQLTFHTKLGRQYGPYGGQGGFYFEAKPPKEDCFLAWISGKADLRLDAINFHWRCPIYENMQRPDLDRMTTTSAGTTIASQQIFSNNVSAHSKISLEIFSTVFLYIYWKHLST